MKKLVALLLSLVMVLSLAACGQKNDPTQTQGGKETQGTDKPGSDETKAPDKPNVPALKGPGNVTLKRLGNNISWDPNTDGMAAVIKEVTGYDVEYFTLPAENSEEKLIMDLSGGVDYDAVTVNPSVWRTLVGQGALQPLDDLLEAYGPHILEACTDTIWNAVRGDDGHIYGIAYMYPHPYEIATYMQCRWDLMQAAGITKLPETIDEFYNCLVTLKNHYGDEYVIFTGPYRPSSEGNENWVIPKTIACAFGIYNDWMVDENGKVYYMTEAPGFKDMVEFLTKLYEEGLIDPDWAINTDASIMEKFSSGRAIITASNRALSSNCSQALIDNQGITWDDINYISALKGADGTCTYMSTEALNQICGIPKNSKNAADYINFIDKKVQEQLYINIGVEGTHYTLDEKGEINPINPIFADERGNSYWYLDCTDYSTFQNQWPARVRKSEGQWHAFSAITMNADRSIFVPNTFAFKPASDAYTKNNTALFSSLQDFILQVMSGTRTINDLEKFQSDWVNGGGENVRKEMQEWYDSFYK